MSAFPTGTHAVHACDAGHTIMHGEENTTVVAMMRAGEPMARAMWESLAPAGVFVHYHPAAAAAGAGGLALQIGDIRRNVIIVRQHEDQNFQ